MVIAKGMTSREKGRVRRHRRIRKKIFGTAERPRLAVHRSSKHIVAQVIDDLSGKTLVNQTTLSKGFKEAGAKGSTVEGAKKLGEMIGQAAQGAGIRRVVFDRGGYMYHGRVRAVAEGARSAGLEF